MVDVTTRAAKGSALTFEELDANWTNLKNAIESIPAGDQGPAGADGASAYQIALDNGFVGDEAAWLASLVGPAGADGTDGADGTSYDPTEFNALQSEIETARGDRSNLNNRITTISNFASPNAGGIVVGNWYDNSFHGGNSATAAGVANRFDMFPFYTSARLRIDRIAIAVSTAVASALAKIVIYGSDADGWPTALLYEGGNLDCSSTGGKEETLDFTFDSGRQYWLGVRMSSTATLRTLNASSSVNLGLASSGSSTYYNVLRRTLTYANAAPDPFNFTSADLAFAVPISVRMRAAALP